MASTSAEEEFDVVIIGAGISGINAAYRIQADSPHKLKYTVLEGRDSMGGTWDLFRYPGIRSDSDMFTFGFSWNPWDRSESLATGGQITDYMRRSAEAARITQHIRYGHSVQSADWNPEEKSWHLYVKRADQQKSLHIRTRFLMLGTGYYNYEEPLRAVIPGIENFQGKVIHPQFWPEDYDYTGKDVVVIGSGATAITILPAMVDRVRSITMLQRSPGYVSSLSTSSFFTRLTFAILPAFLAHRLSRFNWIILSYLSTAFCLNFPGMAKSAIKRATLKQLPPSIKWDPNFKPRYDPWEQRFCACKNGDFFAALRSGKADVVTDKIKEVREKTIELESGASLHPDVIITATGLKLKFGGGIRFSLDGEPINLADRFAWKAAMVQDVPNLFFMTGYERASWTLGADVSAQLFIRLLRLMEKSDNARVVVPRLSSDSAAAMEEKSMMALTSTYLQSAGKVFPKGGTGQWRPKSNYFADIAGAKWGDVMTDLVFM